MLSDDTLLELIRRGESDRVEFTESTTDMDKVRQAICAFANDLPDHRQPGVFFMGLKDDGSSAGLTIDDKLLQTLGGLRNDGKILPFPTIEIDKRLLNGIDVAVIQVEPSDNPPVKVDGRCWIRVGPRRAQATAGEERRLTEKRAWGNLPYDAHSVPLSSVERDLDLMKFSNDYLPAAVSPEVLRENDRQLTEQLQALRLTTPDGIPTATAILMLGKDPRYWFPGAYIQFVRFAGNELSNTTLDQAELSGPLPEQLQTLDLLLKRNIATALDLQGATHAEKPDYPFDALRELVRNAVIHRTYESYTPVRVTWFADRVEIRNPGSVYGDVTKENFGQPGVTAYRNPTLAEAMKTLGFMQRFGIGIQTARNALAANGNPPPEFDIQDTFFCVTIHQQNEQP